MPSPMPISGYTVDGTLRGQPLRGQNDDFEKSFRGTLRGHRGTFRGQNGNFPKSFCPLKVPSTVPIGIYTFVLGQKVMLISFSCHHRSHMVPIPFLRISASVHTSKNRTSPAALVPACTTKLCFLI